MDTPSVSMDNRGLKTIPTRFLDRFFREDTSAHAALCSCLSPKNLMKLLATSHFINNEVTAYIRRAFSIERILQPFFSSPENFRKLQAATGTLISGSAALQFFDRAEYPDSDLDLYVEHRYGDQVVDFLEQEGYSFRPWPNEPLNAEDAWGIIGDRIDNEDFSVPEEGVDDYAGGGLAGVLHFHKGDREVQLICARESPLTIICSFHSTCVMNFISHEKAYSLFPRATLEDRESLSFWWERDGDRAELSRQKYVSRGWKMIDSLGTNSDFHQRPRWIGDAATWTVRLTPDLDLPPDFRETSGFWLCSFRGEGPKLLYTILRPSLLHQVVIAPPEFAEAPVASIIHEEMIRWGSEIGDPSNLVNMDVVLHEFVMQYRSMRIQVPGQDLDRQYRALLTSSPSLDVDFLSECLHLGE